MKKNEKVFHMGKANEIFKALRSEKVSEKVKNSHLGAIGATNVEEWTSLLGGTLRYESSNGGCSLYVILGGQDD